MPRIIHLRSDGDLRNPAIFTCCGLPHRRFDSDGKFAGWKFMRFDTTIDPDEVTCKNCLRDWFFQDADRI